MLYALIGHVKTTRFTGGYYLVQMLQFSYKNCPKSIDKPKKNTVYLNGISKFLSYRKINYENLIKKEEELLYFVLLKS